MTRTRSTPSTPIKGGSFHELKIKIVSKSGNKVAPSTPRRDAQAKANKATSVGSSKRIEVGRMTPPRGSRRVAPSPYTTSLSPTKLALELEGDSVTSSATSSARASSARAESGVHQDGPPLKELKEPTKGTTKGTLSRSVEVKERGTYPFAIGVDEAGRGPLAGPVVAAACYIGDGVVGIDGVMDSKLVSDESKRERLYDTIVSHPEVVWGVSVVDRAVIDDINILQATMVAMRQATEDLLKKRPSLSLVHTEPLAATSKGKGSSGSGSGTDREGGRGGGCVALIDGNRCPENMPVPSKFIIKGDGKIFSIAAASIIAKVTRDRIMHALHAEYPVYGFNQHKGYGTAVHMTALAKHGPCPCHRFSYAPVAKYAAAKGKGQQ
jgi:ribonuclease HII